jgi:hypothetical protein
MKSYKMIANPNVLCTVAIMFLIVKKADNSSAIRVVEVCWVDVTFDQRKNDSCCDRAEIYEERNTTLVIITV